MKRRTTAEAVAERKVEKPMETKNGVKLSPPWVEYVNELNALFGQDPEVTIAYDGDAMEVKLLVKNPNKADALARILPLEKEYGNVKLKVTVVPGNADMTREQIYRAAFEGNPVFAQAVTVDGISSNSFTYVGFVREVVQYWNDNMADPHGNKSTLYQEIARDVFAGGDGVCFYTVQ